VAEVLQEHFVAVAADADAPEEGVKQLAMKLENAMMLPFVLFADAEGGFLDGSSGLVRPGDLVATAQRLVDAAKD
jgi:hypothetical protein